MLRERAGWDAGMHLYTDSARDLPLAQRALRVTLVNASPRTIAAMRAGAPGVAIAVESWSDTTSLDT